jgi:hypothetical protein
VYKSIFKCFQLFWTHLPRNRTKARGPETQSKYGTIVHKFLLFNSKMLYKRFQKMSPVVIDGFSLDFGMYAFEICESL